jgi:hypothetical protein
MRTKPERCTTIPSASWRLIALLILCTAGCAHQVPTVGAAICPRPPPLSPELLAPAPPLLIFSRCLREILALADEGASMSATCSTFLRDEPTEPPAP